MISPSSRLARWAKSPVPAAQAVALLLLPCAVAGAAWLPPQTRHAIRAHLPVVALPKLELPSLGAISVSPAKSPIAPFNTRTLDYRAATDKAQARLASIANLTLVVNSTGDSNDDNPGDGVCMTSSAGGAECTLRAAIEEANASGGATINFGIPGGGVQSIGLLTQLPFITQPVIIDGYTQPGAKPNTLAVGDNANLLIQVNAGGITGGGLVLAAGSDGSTLRGLNVAGANGSDIFISGSDGNTVAGCFIGTNPTGTSSFSDPLNGVVVQNANNNTIGGAAASARNLVSGNGSGFNNQPFRPGIFVAQGSSKNTIQNNYLGTNASGTGALGNGGGVQLLSDPSDPTVMTGNVIKGNLISGNKVGGLYLTGAQITGTIVQGNFIGSDASGTSARGVPNGGDGVQITGGASNNTIGTAATTVPTTLGQGNLITDNDGVGVDIQNSNSNSVRGNYIGTDVTGKAAPYGNGSNGIGVTASSSTTIAGNLICASGVNTAVPSVLIIGGGNANAIQSNSIGVLLDGTTGRGSTGQGIQISSSASDATATSNTNIADNVVSANGSLGIDIDGPKTTGTKIQNNLIGTNKAGTAALGNNGGGVQLLGSTGALVTGNTISGNRNSGLVLNNGANNNTITGNKIGTNAAGTAALGNALNGIGIVNSGGNTIGGAAASAGNVVSGNGAGSQSPVPGILIQQGAAGVAANTIQGNTIGTNAAGTAAIGNSGAGIQLFSTANDAAPIKGTVISGNLLSGNGTFGLNISGAKTTGTIVQNNKIGTNAAGNGAIPNALGVQILDATGTIIGNAAAQGTSIGTPFSGGAGNNISYNTGGGLGLSGTGNAVNGNSITHNGNVGIAVSNDNNTIRQNDITGTTGSNVAGTFGSGMLIGDDCTGTIIQSNNVTGNAGNGILFYGAAPGHTVGDPLPASGSGSGGPNAPVQTNTAGQTNSPLGNYISNNGLAGVSVQLATQTACHRKSILGNSFGTNGTIPIDLGGSGKRLANQPASNQGDKTTGPNALQNYPVLSGVTVSADNRDTITGTLTSAPNAKYRIEFYSYISAYEGYLYVTTNASGVAPFSVVLADPLPVSGGQGASVSATATDAVGNTSEFSPAATNAALTATATTLTSSRNPSQFGQTVTFTAKVSLPSAAGTPTGTVTFKDGSTTIGTGTLNANAANDVATFSTANLATGAHNITAIYNGDANFNTSTSAALTQTVNAAPPVKTNTTTTLTSSANPSTVGQSVTFTASVAPASGTAKPTGTVTFKDGTTTIGTGTLNNGVATFATSTLAQGTHSITASYGGNANFNASKSATLRQVVNAATTTGASRTTLTSSLNPSTVGQSVTFTATVTSVTGTTQPTGTVTFRNGAVQIGAPVPLVNGVATSIASTPPQGNNTIVAAYSGNNVLNFSSATLTQVVNAAPASPTLSINNVTASESNSSTKTFIFTVTLAPAATKTVTVRYATANGTATAGSDYSSKAGTLTFAPGVTSQTIPVTVNGDTTREANETFTVKLSGATNATLGIATATGTIQNDDFVADLSVTESASPASVPRGSQVTFNIVVTNNGPDAANNVTLTDTLPTGATFVSSTPTQTSTSGSTRIYALGTIASGASRTIALRVQTPDTIGTVTNTASVAQTGATDPSAANNSATANATTTNGAPAFVYSVGKLINVGPYSPSLYHAGARFVQDVTIINNGTAPANAPLQLVLDGLPSSVKLTNAGGVAASTGAPFVNLPSSLAVGQKVTVRLQFQLSRNDKPSFTPRVESGELDRK